ncbi:hypothetical protein [Amycolatopsis sp. CA-230715]|uniref:hypothetical protein n=1 Tax=Amycolatopsis sp. CA-230715 TaxID=2745196 RepID=UPI001C034E96|nr:hypothetical protein [Amycolatopsis sp. CA-230715]QWF78932.1 hypothetical protein HUW46_02331 [Amycolatopsis sp. CA-230715]
MNDSTLQSLAGFIHERLDSERPELAEALCNIMSFVDDLPVYLGRHDFSDDVDRAAALELVATFQRRFLIELTTPYAAHPGYVDMWRQAANGTRT